MSKKIMNRKKMLGVFAGLFALYMGQGMLKSFLFFLEAGIFFRPMYLIFTLPGFAYLYLIIGLIMSKKWAWYLFIFTLLIAILFNAHLLFEGVKVRDVFIGAMLTVWPLICLVILPLFIITIFIKRKGRRANFGSKEIL